MDISEVCKTKLSSMIKCSCDPHCIDCNPNCYDLTSTLELWSCCGILPTELRYHGNSRNCRNGPCPLSVMSMMNGRVVRTHEIRQGHQYRVRRIWLFEFNAFGARSVSPERHVRYAIRLPLLKHRLWRERKADTGSQRLEPIAVTLQLNGHDLYQAGSLATSSQVIRTKKKRHDTTAGPIVSGSNLFIPATVGCRAIDRIHDQIVTGYRVSRMSTTILASYLAYPQSCFRSASVKYSRFPLKRGIPPESPEQLSERR